jgi:hypothetical protein
LATYPQETTPSSLSSTPGTGPAPAGLAAARAEYDPAGASVEQLSRESERLRHKAARDPSNRPAYDLARKLVGQAVRRRNRARLVLEALEALEGSPDPKAAEAGGGVRAGE